MYMCLLSSDFPSTACNYNQDEGKCENMSQQALLAYTLDIKGKEYGFYTPTRFLQGLYFHCSLSACVSVCPALLVKKKSSRLDAPI